MDSEAPTPATPGVFDLTDEHVKALEAPKHRSQSERPNRLAMLFGVGSRNDPAFRRLTVILERKGIITAEELAEVYGEQADTPEV